MIEASRVERMNGRPPPGLRPGRKTQWIAYGVVTSPCRGRGKMACSYSVSVLRSAGKARTWWPPKLMAVWNAPVLEQRGHHFFPQSRES